MNISTAKTRSSSWRLKVLTDSVRARLSIVYFLIAYGLLYLYTSGSSFCGSGIDHAFVTAKLALACTAWDGLAGGCGELAFRLLGKRRVLAVVAPSLGATVTALGVGSIPFWIYRGYGAFLFENTWADVSCFFTEGYGLLFPFMVAPLLAMATFGRVVLILMAQAGDESE